MKLHESAKQVLLSEDIYGSSSGTATREAKSAFKKIVSTLQKRGVDDFGEENANIDYSIPFIDLAIEDYTIHIDGENFPSIKIWVQGTLPDYKTGVFNTTIGYDSPKFWDIINNFDTKGYLKLKPQR